MVSRWSAFGYFFDLQKTERSDLLSAPKNNKKKRKKVRPAVATEEDSSLAGVFLTHKGARAQAVSIKREFFIACRLPRLIHAHINICIESNLISYKHEPRNDGLVERQYFIAWRLPQLIPLDLIPLFKTISTSYKHSEPYNDAMFKALLHQRLREKPSTIDYLLTN